jgi:hypothetical protein
MAKSPLEGAMPPKPVQLASWILLVNAVVLKLAIPLGALALSASHASASSHGDSPLLIFMAGGLYFFVVTIPIVLIAALLFVKLRQGRNWARIVVVIVTAISVIIAFRNFQLFSLTYGTSMDLAKVGSFVLSACASPIAMVATAVLLFSATADPFFGEETRE